MTLFLVVQGWGVAQPLRSNRKMTNMKQMMLESKNENRLWLICLIPQLRQKANAST